MLAHSIVRPPTSIVACVPLIHRSFSILSYPSRSGSGNEYFHSRERIAPSMYVVIFISRGPGMQLNCHPGATDAGSYPSFRFFKISTPTGIPVVWNWRSTLWSGLAFHPSCSRTRLLREECCAALIASPLALTISTSQSSRFPPNNPRCKYFYMPANAVDTVAESDLQRIERTLLPESRPIFRPE